MLVIGLAGGIACGKSLVADCFAKLGCIVIDADQVGHEVLRQPEIVAQIQHRFGDEVISGGEVDRRELAQIVFPAGGHSPSEALQQLEQITHPQIGQSIFLKLEQYRSQGVVAVVLDAPVMFKAGWNKFCDRIVYIDADREVREQRALKRGWSKTELERRENQQTPLRIKRQLSTDVVTNSSSVEELNGQVKQLWRQWNLPS